VMTDIFFPNEDFSKLALITDESEIAMSNTRIYTMNSIWE
jgi:hypothetical protein